MFFLFPNHGKAYAGIFYFLQQKQAHESHPVGVCLYPDETAANSWVDLGHLFPIGVSVVVRKL